MSKKDKTDSSTPPKKQSDKKESNISSIVSTLKNSNKITSLNTPKISSNVNEKKEQQKNLVLRRLDYTNNQDKTIRKELNNLYDDPNKFFITHYQNKEVVFGKRHHVSQDLEWDSLLKKVKKIKTLIPRSKKDQSVSSVRELNLSKSQILQRKMNGQQVDDQEIKKIYETFQQLQKENSENNLINTNNPKNLLKGTSYKLKNQLLSPLRVQTKVLKNMSVEKTNQEKMKNYLNKRVIRNNSTGLLFENSEKFRIRNEVKNELYNYYLSETKLSLDKWYTDLRSDRSSPTKYFINSRTADNPFFRPVTKRPEKIIDIEICRKPLNMIGHSEANIRKECKVVRRFQENPLMRDKFFGKSLYCTNFKRFGNSCNFYDLEIKGKNLLEFEMENVKLIKGKKIINHKEEIDKSGNSFTIDENVFLPNIKENENEGKNNE